MIGVGILADAASLFTGVEVFAAVTGAAALVVAAWHVAAGGGRRATERPTRYARAGAR